MPNRFIKESFLTSRKINTLSPSAETLFFRLVVVADDFGRFDAEPSVVLGRCMPLRVGHPKWSVRVVAGLLDELTVGGDPLIVIYLVGDRRCGFFPNWEQHQGKHRAKTSKYPDPTHENICKQPLADAKQPLADAKQPLADASKCSLLSYSYSNSSSESVCVANTRLQEFDLFWTAYPKKQGKQDARDAWEKGLKDNLPTLDVLMASLERHRASEQWQEPQFIPYPATWLNGKRWEDDPLPLNGTGPLRGVAAFEAREKARQARGE